MEKNWQPLIARIDSILARSQDEKTLGELGVETMVAVMAEQKERIFSQGKNTAMGMIGKYSTESDYYGQKAFIRKSAFKPQGKENKGDFANGNKRKTMFLAGGYSELRQIQARKVDKVNFKYSGSLEAGLAILQQGTEIIYGQSSQYEALKMECLEERFGVVFQLSEDEQNVARETLNDGYSVMILKND